MAINHRLWLVNTEQCIEGQTSDNPFSSAHEENSALCFLPAKAAGPIRDPPTTGVNLAHWGGNTYTNLEDRGINP